MENDIHALLEIGENQEIEFKGAGGGLPKNVWDTYSSFANTNGGVIILGIEEKGDALTVVEIDVDQLLKNLWSTLNNSQKISRNILTEDDVQVLEYSQKKIIKISVRRAYRDEKPIYIGFSPLTGSYKRNYEGDYKCTEREVRAMLADQSDETQDRKILEDFTIEDLDIESVNGYPSRLAALKPHHPFLAKKIPNFLIEIGAWGRNRQSKKEGLTAAGLLMFGKERAITDEFPQYFLDYREYSRNEASNRWSHRIVSNDGTWAGNIYEFFFKVINRLTEDLNIPFRTVDLLRQQDTNVHIALREALANTLLHADFYGDRGIVIEKYPTSFQFSNPGSMRVSVRQAMEGGVSDPRNASLFKMFSLIGLGERAGSGIPAIVQAWNEQHWRIPEIKEEVQPDRTTLILLSMSLLPEESVSFLKSRLKERYESLEKEHILALVTAHQEKSVTNKRLQVLLDQNSQKLNKLLSFLVEQGLLLPQGKSRWMSYVLSDLFKVQIQHSEDIVQHNDELIQHNEDLTPHNNERVQHKEDSTQHNGESVQHTEEPTQHYVSEDSMLQSIAIRVNTRKRVTGSEMMGVILELCKVRALDIRTIATLINRGEATIYNHYLMKLVREQRLIRIYDKKNSAWVYAVPAEES
ncbi:putative DNA binding domain-containing protein [Saccharibacillus sp. CPCC 101409]|uniref:RNA-binding domain-containing protein n=1 Tax=Saccharibacillus sp. CPCC 101409 TaxID=3058041 RepID=UPI002671A38E|nr:RNA-binding domain-containing protein [Saccharibacillus sp. CPCC 101409]MDO3409729.1 putative DNA binding domain-containing protein [Saccharibacillus sp. CPCC 101409]